VGHKNAIRGYFEDFGSYFGQFWSISDHIVIYAGKARDKIGNLTFRIYQAGKLVHQLMTIIFENRYFGNSVAPYSVPGGLYVYDAVHSYVLKFKFKFKNQIQVQKSNSNTSLQAAEEFKKQLFALRSAPHAF